LEWRLALPQGKVRYLWYATAVLSTILAMKTKEISFTLPLMILMIEGIFFWPVDRKHWITLIPFLITLLIIPLSLPDVIGGSETGLARETADISRSDYLFTQFRVIVTYLRLLIFPFHQNLDYDFPVYHSVLELQVLLSFLFLSGLLGLAVFFLFCSQYRLIAFGLLWFFLTLSIESSIIPIRDVIFEHRLYLPSVGFLMAGSFAIMGLLHRRKITAAVVVGVIVGVLSIAAYERNLTWKDEVTLWTDVVKGSPNKARGYNNLAEAYITEGRLDEAVQAAKRALALKPDYARAHYNLGTVNAKLGYLDEAIEAYKTALVFKPNYASAYYSLGVIYHKQGRLPEAVQAYKAAIAYLPDFVESYYNLGLVYYEQGRFSEAVGAFAQAVQFRPDYFRARNNLGNAYVQLGQWNEAVQAYKSALAFHPGLAETYYNLGVVYSKQGKSVEAIRALEQALQLKPDYEKARQALKSLGR
jgi:tetratricopeptide (TPR) repeat protein